MTVVENLGEEGNIEGIRQGTQAVKAKCNRDRMTQWMRNCSVLQWLGAEAGQTLGGARTLQVASGLTTNSKDTTSNNGHRY